MARRTRAPTAASIAAKARNVSATVTFRLTLTEHAELAALAKRRGIKPSLLMRGTIRRLLDDARQMTRIGAKP